MNEQVIRGKKIIQTSIVGIVVNLLLVAVKITIGVVTGSMSVISDAMNNLSDSVSSVLTIVGTALSGRKPDKKHPFGYGRVEYMTSLIIAVVVLVTGGETFLSSFKSLFQGETAEYTVVSVVIIAVTVAAKLLLGVYTKSMGKKLDADALVASGAESMGDALLSLLIIASALLSMIFHVSIDAFAGMFIALFIIKTGLEIVMGALNKLLGERAQYEYARRIVDEVGKTEGILGAHDLIVHDYGPAMNIGSLNVELDAHMSVGEAYPILHRMQEEILKKYRIYLIFGFYSVNEDLEDAQKLRETVERYVAGQEHCLGCHGLFVDREAQTAYCDVVLDYEAERGKVREELAGEIGRVFPGYEVHVTIDTEFA